MKIAFGVDPGGWELREGVKKHLEEMGHEVIDVGTQDMQNAIPYMYVGRNVAQEVTSGRADFGVVMCGTGIGISMATNKNQGARCAFCDSYYIARDSRIVNNANIIAMGGRISTPEEAYEMVTAYLNAKFAGGRHAKRVDKITAIEEGNY